LGNIRTINKELNAIRAALLKDKKILETWKADEHKLLSPHLKKVKKTGIFNRYWKAILINIFGENIAIIAAKKYKNRTLCLLITTSDEFVFLNNDHGTTWYQNGKQIAVALPDGNIVSSDGKYLLLKVAYDNDVEFPVYYLDKIVAGIPVKPDKKAVSPRAIFYYSEPEKTVIDLLNCLCITHIVKINIPEIRL
jgi:hypothetical protein